MAYRSYGQSRWWDSESLSFILGWVAGIRVRIHLYFVIMIAFELLRAFDGRFFGYALFFVAVGFFSVLLHEFGHCFGCRYVGGTADDILMWPLGGLAYCAPPHRPWPNLITTLAGPAVNLAICLILFPFLLFAGAGVGELVNPFNGYETPFQGAWWFLRAIYTANYWLLLFNMLLPLYPMDCGRAIQEILWFRMGYEKSLYVMTTVGLVVGSFLGIVALWVGQIFLFLICLAGVYVCYRQRVALAAGAAYGGQYDAGESWKYGRKNDDEDDRPAKPGRKSIGARFGEWRRRRAEASREKLEEEVDRILAKIHDQGLASLSEREKTLLKEASEKRRG
jgi:Zn-dependent protease